MLFPSRNNWYNWYNRYNHNRYTGVGEIGMRDEGERGGDGGDYLPNCLYVYKFRVPHRRSALCFSFVHSLIRGYRLAIFRTNAMTAYPLCAS